MKSIITTLTILTSVIALESALAPARSQSADKITEAAVRQYYAELPNLFKRPYEQFARSYADRASDNLKIVNKTTIFLEGQPPTETTETMNKQQLMQGSQQAWQAAQSARLSSQIMSIKISEDGRTARVRETSMINGMSAPGADAAHAMKADSQETCVDDLALETGIGIQTVHSECMVSVKVAKKIP